MMSDTGPAKTRSAWSKHKVPLVIGFAGGVGWTLLSEIYDFADAIGAVPFSIQSAVAVGAFYVFCAGLMAFGMLYPALGYKIFEFEDADEVAELKAVLIDSALALALLGVALAALALAAPTGPLQPAVALVIGAGGLLAGSWFAAQSYRKADELFLSVGLEGAALTFGLVLLVVGGWGMLAHLGFTAGPAPLDLLTACYVLALIATGIVSVRRGLTKLP